MKYHAGQWVILSDYGMKQLRTQFHRAKIIQCVEDNHGNEGYVFYCFTEPDLMYERACKDWIEVTVTTKDVEDFIAEEGPLVNIPQEDIEKLPWIVQHNEVKFVSQEPTTTNDVIANPAFSDWELPEVVIGWVLYYVLFFAVGIFNSEIIQWVLRIVLMVVFLVWRSKKVYGLK